MFFKNLCVLFLWKKVASALERLSLVPHPLLSMIISYRTKPNSRPPSPSTKLLGGNNDASAVIDLVISQIASNDINTNIQALAQIDEVFKDVEKREMMVGHIDQLLLTTSIQLRMSYTKHMGDNETPQSEVIRLYRCILGTLLAVSKIESLDTSDLNCQGSPTVLLLH